MANNIKTDMMLILIVIIFSSKALFAWYLFTGMYFLLRNYYVIL